MDVKVTRGNVVYQSVRYHKGEVISGVDKDTADFLFDQKVAEPVEPYDQTLDPEVQPTGSENDPPADDAAAGTGTEPETDGDGAGPDTGMPEDLTGNQYPTHPAAANKPKPKSITKNTKSSKGKK